MGDDAKKENIIGIVAQMSKADGKISANEMVYLLQLGESLNVDAEKVREILYEDDVQLFVPPAEVDRMTIFYYIVFLMKVDGKIEESEKNLLYHLGVKLGFNHLMISDVVNVINKYINQKMPVDAILNEVKKYLN